MDSAAAALLGALIGATAPIVAKIWHDARFRQDRAKQVSLAIRGEIAAVMGIIQQRNYIQHVRSAESDARNGNVWPFRLKVTHNYFPVVEASLTDLGILPDNLPSLIPRFLTYAKSALEDIKAIDEGLWEERDQEQWCNGYKELVDVLERAMQAGTDIIAIVERRYSPS